MYSAALFSISSYIQMLEDKDMAALSGSCLCGNVRFEIADNFDHFQFCFCTQCQKSTGTGHASNLFTDPINITWLSGEEDLIRYDVPERRISNVFCKQCGSRMPWLSLSGDTLAVPAGCLDHTPQLKPQAKIFWPERPDWYDFGSTAPTHDRFSS